MTLMLKRFFAPLVLLLGLAVPLPAQTEPAMERVLIPTLLPPEGILGGFGSLWMTRFRSRNNADQPVLIRDYDYGCRMGNCPPAPPTLPKVTFSPQTQGAPPTYGLFMFVERAFIDDVSFSLHVQDQTRQSIHQGTRIPIVREQDFRPVIRLLDVPTTGDFRALIRIYSPHTGRVRIRYYASDPSNIHPVVPSENQIATEERDLEQPPPLVQQKFPATAVVEAIPSSPTTRAVVEIEALTPDMSVWAYASVTHNVTQHVTIIAP